MIDIDRFRRDLDALVAPDARLGIAVSGGPDSLALLLLAAEARPGQVEAATVDHALRPASKSEAEVVAEVCARLGVPHVILSADWDEKPETAIQERAREMRYRLLGEWARERRLTILTAHHLDDQAETLLMRLARGAGVRGLAGMRSRRDTWCARFWAGAIRSWKRSAPPRASSPSAILATRTSSSSASGSARHSLRRIGSTPPRLPQAPHISPMPTWRWIGPPSKEWQRAVRKTGRDRLSAQLTPRPKSAAASSAARSSL